MAFSLTLGIDFLDKLCKRGLDEVIYAGIYNSVERILRMVIDEKADASGGIRQCGLSRSS